jgi:hypothetical protein
VLDAAKAYCGESKDCEVCQNVDSGADIAGLMPDGEELECQGRVLEAANACLKSPLRCEECVNIALQAQCEESPPSERERMECLLLLGSL